MSRGDIKVWERTIDPDTLQRTKEDGYYWNWACEWFAAGEASK